MSSAPQEYSFQIAPTPIYYSSTPPAPPPKPSGTSTPSRGPPLPPPPHSQQSIEPSELDAGAQTYRQPQIPSQVSIPAIESNWLSPTLKDKSTSDLHHFFSTPALQSALISNPETTHPAISASESNLAPLIASNVSLAASTVDLEARLRNLREHTQSRLLALRALEQQHRAKIAEAEDVLREFSPMALYQRLSASVQEQELLVRGIEESWLDDHGDKSSSGNGVASEREAAEFVRRVKESRKTAFLRRERKARWDEGRVGGWR